MHWRWWAAALATVTGSVLVAWWVVGFLGFPPWLTALLAVIAALLVLGFVALYVAPYVLGTVDGIRDGLAGRPADEDLLERLRSMTINQVRRRADDFEQRARAAKGGRSSEARENAHIYELPASRWRQLESAMRRRMPSRSGIFQTRRSSAGGHASSYTGTMSRGLRRKDPAVQTRSCVRCG